MCLVNPRTSEGLKGKGGGGGGQLFNKGQFLNIKYIFTTPVRTHLSEYIYTHVEQL